MWLLEIIKNNEIPQQTSYRIVYIISNQIICLSVCLRVVVLDLDGKDICRWRLSE